MLLAQGIFSEEALFEMYLSRVSVRSSEDTKPHVYKRIHAFVVVYS